MKAGFVWEGRGRDSTSFLFLYIAPDPRSSPCMTTALQSVSYSVTALLTCYCLTCPCARLPDSYLVP